MSFDVNWDIDKYREDHESDEHWQLRRNFMERWQSSYPEERLVCLARVFANMEFMGCRYPQEVMQEVARMSKEVNRGVTYNNNFANLSAFDGQYVAQDTESATSETTNSDKNQDSSENQYVWSSYTSEVMQGPVSISKVLRTEHLKSIIRENSPNLRMGSSLNKFPRMDLSSQSNLSEFIDDSIETVKTYPGNVAKYQKSSDSVWTRASNKPNIQEMQTPQAGINTSDLQYQNLSQADNYMSHPVVNPQQFNDTDMRCMQVTYNNYMPRPVVDAQQFNDTDMRCMQVIQSGPYQEHTNFDRSSYQQGKPSSLGANTLENQAQNYWSQPVCSTGLTNLQNPTNQANIAIRLSNIAANTSNIVTSNYTPASNIDAYVNNVHTPAPQDSNIDVEAGKIRVKQKQSKKRTWKKRHGNAEARRYRYWIDAGKSKSEAKRLSTIKLSKVPEYKEIKKEMGSVRKHCRESFIASQQQKLNKRLNMNNFIGNKYKYVKPPEEKKLGDGEKNKTGTDTTVNALSNTATVTSMNKTPITSNIPASVSNITVSTNNTNAENSVSAFTSSGNICSPVSDINSLTNDAKGTSRKSRKDNWIETQQNKIHMESISHLPPEEKPLVKQLKDTTKATMLKLAYKDKFKQRLTNTQNSNQYLNIESNTVIEITDDEADAENNAKVKEEIEKDMQLKNRKTEEEAIFLCQIPMPSSDAEKVPKQDVTKDLQEKNLPVEVANEYRDSKKTKLQRTFVSASDAAEDRARGVKREGGVILEGPQRKTSKIEFVKPGQVEDSKSDDESTTKSETGHDRTISEVRDTKSEKDTKSEVESEEKSEVERIDYLTELSDVKCLDVRRFRNNMFGTRFGKFVLMVRSWAGKLWNIQSSCQVCGLNLEHSYDNECGRLTLSINGVRLAEASGATKQIAKKLAGDLAWNIIKEEAVLLLVKEQFIAHNDARISVRDVSATARPSDDQFGTPVETSVASKMMKLMGWKGGGLGADAQGIAEPIKPHLQMVNRAGLGSMSSDIRQLKRAVDALMRRYIASDCLDVDLVFSSDFSKEERAALHQVAKNAHLVSRSYGQGDDRFLVVKKKLDPFSLVQAVIEKGGMTPKYQVFIPAALNKTSYQR